MVILCHKIKEVLVMASWDEIVKEMGSFPNQFDSIRAKYLKELSSYTNRNTIAYYSSFLNKPSAPGSDMNDQDMNGFMNAMKGVDAKKGLDLILHTPGGSPLAAEAIVDYLRSKFKNNIRVIVPQLAMSAGTMIACSSKEIFMGKESSLGPINPQFNGIPAYSILKEFEQAKTEIISNPASTNYWAILLNKYPAAFVYRAQEAVALSNELVLKWLHPGMVKNKTDAEKIVSKLNEHDESKEHGRHFNIDYCRSIGLKVTAFEDDQELQDKVLSVHHSFMITFGGTPAVKIIQNDDRPWIVTATD